MAEDSVDVKQEGGLFLVDPNPAGRGVVPTEDMFIYVKLIATERTRGVVNLTPTSNELDTSNIGEIHFIATEVTYNNAGEPLEDIMGNVETYATTNYTDIGGLQNSYSSGSLEGFGIKSINIKYNTSFVPQVDISFTDLRGAALFDVIEQDSRKSPYSIFFKMPYPIFTLTVKGYYGLPVDYCLHLTDWTSKFDPSTGNFDIDAKFLGYQQAFLADITVGNILGVMSTPVGIEALSEVPMTDGSNTPTLDKFVKDITKLQIDLEKIKSENSSYAQLEKLNTLRAKIKNISDFIGKPLFKDTASIDDGGYENLPNDPEQIPTTGIKSPSIGNVGIDYLSIRDFLIVPITSTKGIDEYMITLYTLLTDYRDYVIENKNQLPQIKGIINGNSLDVNIYSLTEQKVGNKINYDGIKIEFNTDSNAETAIDFLKTSKLLTKGPANNNFDPSIINTDEFLRAPGNPSNIMKKDIVMMLNFSKMRSEVNRMLIDIDKEKSKKDEAVTKELNEDLKKSIDYNPTIGTVFEVICNNVQALIKATYKTAEAAENRSKARAKALTKIPKIVTDINISEKDDFSDSTIYAFPKIVQNGKELYMGDPTLNLNGNDFPEKVFIKEVIKGFIKKSAQLEEIQKNANILKDDANTVDNWVPINIMDYQDNPFYGKYNTISDGIDGVKKSFYETLLVRYAVLKNYSGLDSNKINQYGMYDGINARISIFDKVIKAAISEDLVTKTAEEIIELCETSAFGKIIINSALNPAKTFNIGSIEITPKNDDAVYAAIDNSSILQSKLQVWEEISELDEYKEMFINKNPIIESPDRWTAWNNNMVVDNISYNVWYPNVNKNLQGTTGNNGFIIPENDITKIDGGIKPLTPNLPGSTLVNAPQSTTYINIFNSLELINDKNGDPVPTKYFLTQSKFYDIQSSDNYARALLLLSTFPFSGFDYLLNEIIKGERDKIIRLPKLFLLFLGGTLWRSTFTIDPIEWESTTIDYKQLGPDGINTNTILNFGDWVGTKTPRGNCPAELMDLPKATKDVFIDYFLSWVDNGFVPFRDAVKFYSEEIINENDKWSAGVQLVQHHITPTSELAIYTSKAFHSSDFALDNSLSVDGFGDYYNSFVENFEEDLAQSNVAAVPADPDEDYEQLKDFYLAAYNDFKIIYDSWIAGNEEEDLSYNACGTAGKKLFDYFRFIDRAFNDIGDIACINLDSVANLTDSSTINVYYFLAKILRDNNFILQILPSYINFKDPSEVAKMFKPITNISERNSNSGPTYLCIYGNGNSEVLNINEQSRYTFTNDGFDILKNPPADISTSKNTSLVAFRVSFGSENQSLFQSVALNQQEHRKTAEYHAALAEMIDKRGGAQRSFKGTDLYSLYRTRSYTCSVESLGCMNIQPMMYFQLDNVPFFDGAYMILNVTHNITPNHMTTNFTGWRQSTILTPIIDKITTFLALDLNQVQEGSSLPQLSNYTNQDKDRYNIGIDVDKDPDGPFDYDLLTKELFRSVGVTEETFNQNPDLIPAIDKPESLKNQLIAAGVVSKSDVTMLLANMLTISNNFSASVEVWNNIDEPTNNQKTYYVEGNQYGNVGNTVTERRDEAYKYRSRGYIPILGHNAYDKFRNSSISLADYTDFLTEMDSLTISSKFAIMISLHVWKSKDSQGKSPSSYAKGGSASNFNQTTNALYNVKDKNAQNNTIRKSFSTWAKLLNALDILGINIDGKK